MRLFCLAGRYFVNIRFACILMLAFLTMPAAAEDVTRDVLQSDNRSSAYAEIGFGLAAGSLPLVGFNERSIEESDDVFLILDGSLEGRIQYKGFFAEVIEDSFSNITLGYSLFDNDRGNLEIIATSLFFPLEYSRIQGLESIEDRESDFDLGLRGSYFFNDSLLQLELVRDVARSHDGFIGAVHIGQQKQFLNWNLFALAGLRYFSDNVIDHILGVSADEATATIPEYRAKAGVMPSLQLGVILPISEKWTFYTKAEYARFPDSVSKSPLAQGNEMFLGRMGFNYLIYN